MKILEITNYTAGGCGVGMRVLKESQLLEARGHKVTIFSTNRIKGSNKRCPLQENQGNIQIRRFPASRLGGESYMKWQFEKEAIKLQPDVIITHAYRHPHTLQSLKIAQKLGCKVFLVTHAPFARRSSRNIIQNLAVAFYDKLIGSQKLNQFTKVITITHWEKEYLSKLGVSSKKIEYIPNGVSEEFFTTLKKGNKNIRKVIYWGRISPIKQLDTAIKAIGALKGTFTLQIRGPSERLYLKQLKSLVSLIKANKWISLTDNQYKSSEQIRALDKSDIYVLPSKTEGLPQTLIEAMARGKIVIASTNQASREIIIHKKNGFLYKNGDSGSLVGILKEVLRLSLKQRDQIRRAAREKAEEFRWKEIIKKLDSLIKAKT